MKESNVLVEIMNKAREFCFNVNGSLSDLPEGLGIAIISIYYEYELSKKEIEKEGFFPYSQKEDKKSSIVMYFSKLNHITTCVEAIPEYLSVFRAQKLSEKHFNKFVKEITYDLVYGFSYQKSSLFTKIRLKLGRIKPIINILKNAKPL